jgi:hypothetical protein
MDSKYPTRRQFVKKSLLTGVTAALAAEIAGKGATRAEAAAGGTVGPADGKARPEVAPGLGGHKTYPVTAYGAGEPIYLADLGRCEPASALGRSWTPHQWRAIDFESNHAKGTLIASNQITGVPDVTYPLGHKGWCAIYVGLLSLFIESRVQVRLKRDSVFSILTPNDLSQTQTDWCDLQFGNHEYRSDGIEDLFWKYAELDPDDAIVIRQLKVQFVPGDPDANGNSFTPLHGGVYQTRSLVRVRGPLRSWRTGAGATPAGSLPPMTPTQSPASTTWRRRTTFAGSSSLTGIRISPACIGRRAWAI